MTEVVYTLLRKGDSDEYHLFTGAWANAEHKSCSVSLMSVCKKMSKGERQKDRNGAVADPYFACEDEDSARKAIARKGRSVCGICVSTLYRTPED